MTVLNRKELLHKMIEWTEDEYYWFEVKKDDSEELVIALHKMRIKNPTKRKKVYLKQTKLDVKE